MKNLIYFTLLLIPSLSLAVVSTDFTIKSSELLTNDSEKIQEYLIPLDKSLTLGNINFNDKDIIAPILLARKKKKGDDTGNGGGNLREQVISLGLLMLQDIENSSFDITDTLGIDITYDDLRESLTIDTLKVVEGLSITQGNQELSVPTIVADGFILLDKVTFEDGLLKNKVDYRNLLLRNILDVSNVSGDLDSKAGILYSYLPAFSQELSSPYCDLSVFSNTIVRTPINKLLTEFETSDFEAEAISHCEDRGLNECWIPESVQTGTSLKNISPKVTYTGYKYSLGDKSKLEHKDESCQKLLVCKDYYELASPSQISLESYQSLQSEISNKCL